MAAPFPDGQAELARALRDPRRPLVGTVVSGVDPVFAEIVASQFDLIWVDLEHSALSPRDAQTLVISAAAAGAFSLIRLPGTDPQPVGALLDTGVHGVVLPRVESASTVESLAREFEYPPRGRRGYASRRAALAAADPSSVNGPACIVQVESRLALDAAKEIAGVAACDALVVGTNDLALDLGVPMHLDQPQLLDAIATVREAATSARKGWGVAAGGDPDRLREFVHDGATVVYGSDVWMFAEVVKERARLARGGQ